MSVISEEALTSKDRKELDDSMYGIVYTDENGKKVRKYPLNDEAHVLQAVRFFNKAEAKYKPHLARKIVARAKELKMDWEKWDVLKPYLDKPVKESYYGPDDSTTGTSDFDESHDDPDDCYCEQTGIPEKFKKTLEEIQTSVTSKFFPNQFDDYSSSMHFRDELKTFVKLSEPLVTKKGVPVHINSLYHLWKMAKASVDSSEYRKFIETHRDDVDKWNRQIHDWDKRIENYDRSNHKDQPLQSLKAGRENAVKMKELCIKSCDWSMNKTNVISSISGILNNGHFTESFDEMFGPVIQEAFDAVTGEEIPINHAYTMEEMAKRTLSLDEAKAIERDELIPIKPPKADELYFGSPTNYMPEIDLDRPLFVSPYKGIASIFIWKDWGLQNRIPRGSYNHNYEEWIDFDETKMKKPLKEVHVYVEGAPFIEPFTVEQEGYIHCIKTKDYENNFFKKSWMSPGVEYLIAKTDNMKVEFTRSFKVKVRYYVAGRPAPAGKDWGPSPGGILKFTHRIADDIHDKVERDDKPPTGNQNCLLCTWCAEAQCRGEKILPRPIYSPRDPALDIKPEQLIMGDAKRQSIRGFDNLLEHLQDAKDKFARWYCHVNWKDSKGGHEFLIIKVDEGEYRIMDAQQGEVKRLIDTDYHFRDINWDNSYICRLDNNKINLSKLESINNATPTPWDPKKDIPYMLREGMISEDDVDKLDPPVQESAIGVSNIKLRPATEKDLDQILKWETQTINKVYRENKKILDKMRKENKENLSSIKIITSDGKDIGMYQAYPIDDGEWWYLAEIYLIPEYRDLGIGSLLIKNDIETHDKLVLRVDPENKRAIELYKSLGFVVTDRNEYSWVMRLDKTAIQESAFGEILNGVNPFSTKRVFHISLDGHLDGQIFNPRVPEYLDKYDPSQDKFEDVDTARICFSPSIEGCLNAIMVSIGRWKADKYKEWYVYIPEKPLKEYKHRTTKELIKEKKVYDANVTDEIWIEEPVRLKQYGIIRIDQVSSKSIKDTVPTTKGFTGHRYKYSFKWHWIVKPKVIADLPYDYSPEEVCKDMIADMEKYKYGLAENGTVHSASAHDYDTKYKLQSPEEFEQNGGGICYDYVEFMEGYLNAYGYDCKKYFISTNTADNDTHTFLLVRDGKGWKDGFIYPESSFKLMEGVYEVKNYEEAALKIMDKIFDVNHNGEKYDEIKYYVWEYSGHPPYGSDMETCMKYFSKGDPIHEGTAKKIK